MIFIVVSYLFHAKLQSDMRYSMYEWSQLQGGEVVEGVLDEGNCSNCQMWSLKFKRRHEEPAEFVQQDLSIFPPPWNSLKQSIF